MIKGIETVKTELAIKLDQLHRSTNLENDLDSVYYNLRGISKDLDVMSDYIQDLLKIIAEVI